MSAMPVSMRNTTSGRSGVLLVRRPAAAFGCDEGCGDSRGGGRLSGEVEKRDRLFADVDRGRLARGLGQELAEHGEMVV